MLTGRSTTERYRELTEPSSWRNEMIARADVAHFIAGQIDRPIASREAVVLI